MKSWAFSLATAVCALFSPSLLAQTRHDALQGRLALLAEENPDVAGMFTLGKNDQGDEIKGIRLGSDDASKPAMLVVAGHHGNEVGGVEVAMRFIEDYLQPKSDERVKDSVIYVLPVLNISGYNANKRDERLRAGGVFDSNRDYGDPCRNDDPYLLASTRLLAEFVASHEIVAAVSMHGYIGTFTFPWGTLTTDSHTMDHGTFLHMAQQAVVFNGYRTGTHNDLIYPTIGAFEDWAYYEHGVWTMLLEVSRNLDVAKDARATMEFFALAPRKRSLSHGHNGHCSEITSDVPSRP